MFRSNGDKALNSRCIYQVICCLLVVVLTCVYVFGVWPSLDIAVVNIVCLLFFFSELVPGFVESRNKKKALLFLAAAFIGTVLMGLNLRSDYQRLGSLSLAGLSGWSLMWAVLLTLAACAALVILIRLFRWSQEQWEAVRALRQEHRLKAKESWANFFSARNTHRLAMQEARQKYKQQVQADKQKAQADKQAIRDENQKDGLSAKVQRNKDKRNHKLDWQKRRDEYRSSSGESTISQFFGAARAFGTVAVPLLAVAAIVAFFFLLPYLSAWRNGFFNWIDAVKQFAISLQGEDSIKSGQQALLYYILLYIVVATIIAVLIHLVVGRIKQKRGTKSKNNVDFLELYQDPIAILVVFGSFLYVLTDGKFNFNGITEGWQILLVVILLVLVLVAAVEIVRIAVAQCAETCSLLKRITYLVFVAVMKFLSELLLGVITNFRIQMIISSLFGLVFPAEDEAAASFNRKLTDKLNQMFHEAIDDTDGCNGTPESKVFRRKRIWRRRKK